MRWEGCMAWLAADQHEWQREGRLEPGPCCSLRGYSIWSRCSLKGYYKMDSIWSSELHLVVSLETTPAPNEEVCTCHTSSHETCPWLPLWVNQQLNIQRCL